MRRRTTVVPGPGHPHVRLAWLVSFLVTVALVALLGVARSAQAAPPARPASVIPISPLEPEEAEEELEVEECEAGEEWGEEGEAECEEEVEPGAEAPAACLLTKAAATVSASVAHDRVRLAVRYTATTPTGLTLAYWSRGTKGPLSFGEVHEHLERQGVLHQSRELSDAQAAKVLAAREFILQLRPAGVPHYCDALLDRHLTARHGGGRELSWSDPAAESGD